jgi:hypothetical protein
MSQKGPSPIKILLAGGLLIAVATCGFLYYVSNPTTRAQEKIIKNYFNDQKIGLTSDSYFCEETKAITFFAVKSYEIVDKSGDIGGRYTIRVESSNKIGLPTTALFKFEFKKEDNSQGNVCISRISEAQ